MVNSTSRKPSAGFTLVELLVVIVVIAILAAISVVAYNGIQQRAVESKLVTTASTMEKKVHLKKTIDGLASPTGSPATIQAVRQQYDIAAFDDVLVRTLDVSGDCVESRSDDCEQSRFDLLQDGIAIMMIFPTGSTGGGYSGCSSDGGVIIYYGIDEAEEKFIAIEIPDDPDEGVGQSCWALG